MASSEAASSEAASSGAPSAPSGAGRGPTLFTLPAWRPFVDDLAAGLLARYPDPLDLARVLVLLPTRRAGRALGDAFVRLSDGNALLLPRMAPAGDIDGDGPIGDGGPGSLVESATADLPPEFPSRARQLLFARMLAGSGGRAAAEALALAGQLGAALDTLEIEGCRLDDVTRAAADSGLQTHWEVNTKVLTDVLGAWPAVLAARGLVDGAARRNRLLALLADRWRTAPPSHPVVMAGFASAPPAVARLAHVVARLPQGELLFPGLDTALAAETWSFIAGDGEPGAGNNGGLETHPQFGMARLLATVGAAPAEVQEWPYRAPVGGSPPARAALAARAMRPAQLGSGSEGGRQHPAPPEALQGLRLAEAASPAEEALLIAIALRQVVEVPGCTAALVTPDRALARRVAVQLQRFGIDIDDSAGTPLDATAPGSLLVALAAAAAEGFAPVPLLALLQHPLVQAGEGRVDWLNRVRSLDREALRGLRPPPGLAGLAPRLSRHPGLKDWWDAEVRPALAAMEPAPANAQGLLDALRRSAEALAGPALWTGETGRALALLFDALAESRDDLAGLPLAPEEAGAFMAGLIGPETVRPRWRRHPQLAIWGPLEARLQSADLMVLGGLNEGSWPGTPAPDPFLAPAVRRLLGLPGLPRRTGLQAHDFATALGAPEVLVTRALREGGAPAVPSRFWHRLVAAAGATPDSGRLTQPAPAMLAAARALDSGPVSPPIPRPEPAPPTAVRPRALRVTDVAMLKADPFSFYARRVLGLKPLDARDAEPTGGDRGQVVHDILQHWLQGGADPAQLDTIIDRELARLGERPDLAALWRPRVLRMVGYVAQRLAEEPEWRPFAMEAGAELDWHGIRLKGRADRIDSRDGSLRILDYKTGGLPSVTDVQELWQTQLGLLAAMLARGAFPGIAPAPVTALDYLKLSGGREPGRHRAALGKESAALLPGHIEDAWADFESVAARYLLGDARFRAKANIVLGRRYSDYDHLARVAEWLGR